MPALSGVISHFMNGTTKGGAFTGVIQTLGSAAKGVAVVIVGLGAGLQNLVRLMSGVMSNLRTIGSTAVNFVNADGILAKGKALAGGVKAIWTETKDTVVDIAGTTKAAINSASNIFSGTPSFDRLTQAKIDIQNAQLGARGGSKGLLLVSDKIRHSILMVVNQRRQSRVSPMLYDKQSRQLKHLRIFGINMHPKKRRSL